MALIYGRVFPRVISTVLGVGLFLSGTAAQEQTQYSGNAAARAAFDAGKKAASQQDYASAEAAYRKAISLDPNFADAYEEYMTAQLMQIAVPHVMKEKPTPEDDKKFTEDEAKLTQEHIREFEGQAKAHPGKAIYPWVLGRVYIESNPLKMEQYCQRSVQIDPKFWPGYKCLSQVADLRGDEENQIGFARKVSELQPDSPEAAFDYARILSVHPQEFREATMQMIKKFPESKETADALFFYAIQQRDDNNQIQALELMRKQCPPQKFPRSAQATEMLLGLYDEYDPAKGKAVAHELAGADPQNKQWPKYVQYFDAVAKVEGRLNEKDGTNALVTLETIKIPGYALDTLRKDLLHARALDASGKTTEAYTELLANYVKHPTGKVHDAVFEYGSKLGKNDKDIEDEIWSDVRKHSTPAIPFSLPNFTDGQKVSLDNYKGHVVIVDFWYPACGPCRASFPYLQQIAGKYKSKGVVVLAINGMEGQEPFVMPIIKNMEYDFLPLRGTEAWAKDVYNVRAYPSTFLVGSDGNLYYQPHVYNTAEQRSAELEIEQLLKHE